MAPTKKYCMNLCQLCSFIASFTGLATSVAGCCSRVQPVDDSCQDSACSRHAVVYSEYPSSLHMLADVALSDDNKSSGN